MVAIVNISDNSGNVRPSGIAAAPREMGYCWSVTQPHPGQGAMPDKSIASMQHDHFI